MNQLKVEGSEEGYLVSSDLLKETKLTRCLDTFNIFVKEAQATLRYVLPNAISWGIRKYVYGHIKTIELTTEKTKHVAYLNLHGDLNQRSSSAVLLTHGDYGHPYTMLHLADVSQKANFSTFSLYIPKVSNNQDFEFHSELLKKSIDKIESLIKNSERGFVGIIGAGHSKGAILLAHRQFVNLDNRIKATCAIAGRLNVPRVTDCKDEVLREIVLKIYKNMNIHPDKPLMQIVPINDWNASQDSMKVRPNNLCYNVPGMHLSGLYSDETKTYFSSFLKKSVKDFRVDRDCDDH